ncbi:MAG: polyprenyl synthetase family protein [Tannerella sp.]|jgi:octaprenyl-diphosphate synthase|nr:polyprenyl synthetase family protein [Tannerella sp.]
MIDREEIEKPVTGAFEDFQKNFNAALYSEIRTIQSAIETLQHSNGKHIRPLLLLLTAKACGNVTAVSVSSAVMLELVHTASLIHDDVVDETKLRRGIPSVNATHDNRVAVLLGDFILSNALIRAINTGSTQIVRIMADLFHEMAEGEIKQLENADELVLTEKDYFIALEKKTAMLLASCTEIGAITANAPVELQQMCKKFGKLLGYCFQIKDDIFDYFDNINIGKPNGNDIREGKVTLPLLYALESSSPEEKKPYLEILTAKQFTPENVSLLIRFAKEKKGIEYAESRMIEYKAKALEIIDSLPDSEARNSLALLANYLIERAK